MNTNVLALATVALLACEGEPPKTPVGQIVVPPAEAVQEETAVQPPTTSSTAPPSSPPASQMPCPCMSDRMGTSDAGVATADGGSAAPVATLPSPGPAPASVNVVGHIVTTPPNGAASTVVYFEDGPVDPPAKRAPVIDNHMMTFIPFVQVVQAGNRVVFQNSDPFPHNVFSPDNGGFNVGIIAQHASASRVFKKPGEYSLLCNLHPGMVGYVVVTPNGHFAKTDAKGHYAIKDVLPGTYKVTAWAPRQTPVTQSVTVESGDVTLDFELHR